MNQHNSETQHYHSVEALQVLPLDALQALWDGVPNDRQRSYRTAYDREVRNAGAGGSDELESRVAAELLARYRDDALIPIGTRWARTPARVQQSARQNDVPGADYLAGDVTSDTRPNRAVVALGVLLLTGLMAFALLRGNSNRDEVVLVAEPTATATLAVSPTPTPLALEAQDDVVTGGDAERAVAYPVNLQVVLQPQAAEVINTLAPRVWVVQRREVRAAQWNYDPNPDIASFVNGMSARPVIGIPWSPDNAELFERIEAGVAFNLTMNTGAVLRYQFADKRQVLRSDTRIFRQVGPGLVLLLIGETDEDGLPTATRTLITASYPPEQELSRDNQMITMGNTFSADSNIIANGSLPSIVSTPEPASELTPISDTVTGDAEQEVTEVTEALLVQVISATTWRGQLTVRLRIYNADKATASFQPDDIWLALGYLADPPGPRLPADVLAPFELLPDQAADLTLTWPWADEPYAALQVKKYRFALQLTQ